MYEIVKHLEECSSFMVKSSTLSTRWLCTFYGKQLSSCKTFHTKIPIVNLATRNLAMFYRLALPLTNLLI